MTNFLVMSRTRSRIMDPEERESCRQIFDVFAPTYEDTVLKKWKYNAPARVWITLMHRLLKFSQGSMTRQQLERASNTSKLRSRILDAGAGTGLVYLHLSGLGYQNIVWADFSAVMLAQCQSHTDRKYSAFHLVQNEQP